MFKNKRYRQQLASQRQALAEHLQKFKEEKAKPTPRQELIDLWERTARNIQAKIAKLERRLKE